MSILPAGRNSPGHLVTGSPARGAAAAAAANRAKTRKTPEYRKIKLADIFSLIAFLRRTAGFGGQRFQSAGLNRRTNRHFMRQGEHL